ncbi:MULTISPECIES: M20 family metallopeptidase [Vagococcus]|uniref:M20 metallopeptidase family protein n=1 Tax=Vagococcus TaxID=2737 RepID=UPI000E4A038F|nr:MULTISPECIES: M20 family metallopeptidase [Vagococcus]RHH70173.1 amidohydrolase [Vagococcus sp. AM17-17]
MTEEYLIQTRRWLHQHPELSLQEFETTAFIKKELDKMGVAYDTPLETGVVAYIKGTGDKSIAFRADIDALPIHEENNLDYRSQVDNVMHACGHDGHITMLLAFVKQVKELSKVSPLKSTVYFIFQPAEETYGGANILLNQYQFDMTPSFVFGLHMMPDEKEGVIVSKPGPITASATEYRFFVKGLSAHVANKEQGHSAGEALLTILNQLSQLQQYHLAGLHQNIVHIGSFKSGEAINTVPSNAYLEGTIRTYSQEDLDIVKEQMTKIKQASELLTNCSVDLVFAEGYPSTINDVTAYDLMKDASEDTSLTWVEKDEPYLFGEDFSFYQQLAPSSFAFLGCRNEDKGYVTGLHTSTLNFDERVLAKGVELYTSLLKRFEETV